MKIKLKLCILQVELVTNKRVEIKIHKHDCPHSLHDNDINISNCDCVLLEQVSIHNYLGIIIDENFRFNSHTKSLNSKLKRITYIMYFIKDILSIKIKKMLYFALAESIIRYGISMKWHCQNSFK